jgi:hypothetical protein
MIGIKFQFFPTCVQPPPAPNWLPVAILFPSSRTQKDIRFIWTVETFQDFFGPRNYPQTVCTRLLNTEGFLARKWDQTFRIGKL